MGVGNPISSDLPSTTVLINGVPVQVPGQAPVIHLTSRPPAVAVAAR